MLHGYIFQVHIHIFTLLCFFLGAPPERGAGPRICPPTQPGQGRRALALVRLTCCRRWRMWCLCNHCSQYSTKQLYLLSSAYETPPQLHQYFKDVVKEINISVLHFMSMNFHLYFICFLRTSLLVLLNTLRFGWTQVLLFQTRCYVTCHSWYLSVERTVRDLQCLLFTLFFSFSSTASVT